MCDLPVCDCWLYVQITGMCTLLTCVYLCVCMLGCVLWDIAGIPGLIAKIREACVNNSRIQQSCAKEPCLHNVNKLLKLVKAEGIHIQRERESKQAITNYHLILHLQHRERFISVSGCWIYYKPSTVESSLLLGDQCSWLH